MERYLIALDQGTTSSRAVVFDSKSRIVAMKSFEFEQIYPQPGWVEHDPDSILNTQIDALREVVQISGIPLEAIAAIGITNQRETTILWDRATGRPVHRAIVWQCRRTAPIVKELCENGWEEYIRETTGLVPDAYFSGTKLKWLLDTLGLHERAERGELCFGTVDSFLAWNLETSMYYYSQIETLFQTARSEEGCLRVRHFRAEAGVNDSLFGCQSCPDRQASSEEMEIPQTGLEPKSAAPSGQNRQMMHWKSQGALARLCEFPGSAAQCILRIGSILLETALSSYALVYLIFCSISITQKEIIQEQAQPLTPLCLLTVL